MCKENHKMGGQNTDMLLNLTVQLKIAETLGEMNDTTPAHKFSGRFEQRQKALLTKAEKYQKRLYPRRFQTAAAAAIVVLTLGFTATAGAAVLFSQRPANETRLNWGLDSYPMILGPLEVENVEEDGYKAKKRRVLVPAAFRSAEYNALAEWDYFMDAYTLTDKYKEGLLAADVMGDTGYEALSEREKIYELYGSYDAYSVKMLESIADKYDLLLASPVYYTTKAESGALYGLCSFLPEEDFSIDYGYSFEDGSAHCEFSVFIEECEQKYKNFTGSLTVAKKGSLYPYTSGWMQENDEKTEETGYITAQGTHADVAATNDRAWIFYEGDETYIRIQLTRLYYKFYGQGSKKGIDTVKYLADMIDLSVL